LEPITNRAKDYLTQELKGLFNNNKNYFFQTFLQGLTPTESTEYSLWKEAKKQTSQRLHHLRYHKELAQEATSRNEPEEEEALIQLLDTSYQLEPPIKRLKRTEVQEVINSLNPKKSSGYNLITGKNLI
jgi:hypothetical protein